MNNEQIEELKELREAATPGEWCAAGQAIHATDDSVYGIADFSEARPGSNWSGTNYATHTHRIANAYYVAALVNAAPELIALAERAAPAATAPAAAPSEVDAAFVEWFGIGPVTGTPDQAAMEYWAQEAFKAGAKFAASQAEPDDYVLAPHYRGYAQLGMGAYIIGHSAAGEAPELYIKIATDAEKAGRTVGDLKSTGADSAPVQPEDIAVRIRFDSAAGMDALEVQLAELRKEHFIAPLPAASSQERDAKDAARYRALVEQHPCELADMLDCSKSCIDEAVDEVVAVSAAMSAAPAEQAKGGA